MSARYLIRLDDACPTMDRQKWTALETVLDRHAIRPIVAVVPDNRDPALEFGPPDTAFWDKVRGWQAKGWSVAMHGHTHVMHATRHPLLVPFYARSEFAGLPLEEQRAKIRAAWLQFRAEGVSPELWVGPAHSFDAQTLQALRVETPIRIVSDGIALDTWFAHDFYWIPQQMWRLAPRRSGLWTVCLHPNEMSEQGIEALDAQLGAELCGAFIDHRQAPLRKRGKSILGRVYHHYFWWRWRRNSAAARNSAQAGEQSPVS